jgi:hypothetical protein
MTPNANRCRLTHSFSSPMTMCARNLGIQISKAFLMAWNWALTKWIAIWIQFKWKKNVLEKFLLFELVVCLMMMMTTNVMQNRYWIVESLVDSSVDWKKEKYLKILFVSSPHLFEFIKHSLKSKAKAILRPSRSWSYFFHLLYSKRLLLNLCRFTAIKRVFEFFRALNSTRRSLR